MLGDPKFLTEERQNIQQTPMPCFHPVLPITSCEYAN